MRKFRFIIAKLDYFAYAALGLLAATAVILSLSNLTTSNRYTKLQVEFSSLRAELAKQQQINLSDAEIIKTNQMRIGQLEQCIRLRCLDVPAEPTTTTTTTFRKSPSTTRESPTTSSTVKPRTTTTGKATTTTTLTCGGVHTSTTDPCITTP